jgi:hypothetical protein
MSEHVTCGHIVESLSEYVEGTLDEALCVDLERHMNECHDCKVVVDTLRRTIELYHRTAPDVDVPADVRMRLYTCLNLEDYIKKE